MSECAKCNGWGVDDVTGFACPSCRTVKQSLTVEPVSNPDDLAAVMQADAAPVAWDVEQDVYAGELTHEERVKVAQAAIAAIDLPGQREAAARAALEAALRQFSTDPEALDEPDYVDFVFDCIRAIDPAAFRGDDDA